MATPLVEKLTQCAERITMANADSNAALSFSAWLSVHQGLHDYFNLCAGAEQSEEVKESQERFAWKWDELPEFPLRKLLPLAAKTLAQFPDNTALGLLVADFCVDACKQNLLAKSAAMESSVIQGLCRLAAHVAAGVVQNEPLQRGTTLLFNRIFEALHYITEAPTVSFYRKAPEVKREFYSKANKAWSEVDIGQSLNGHFNLDRWDGLRNVNHALFLTFFCLKEIPDSESNKHYLSVLRNIAEPWEFKFPTQNRAYLRFMKTNFQRMERFFSRFDEENAMLVSELLVILNRTVDPESVSYDHTLPYFSPAFNEFVSRHPPVGDANEVQIWTGLREQLTRREVRHDALRIRLEQQTADLQARTDRQRATKERNSSEMQAESSKGAERQASLKEGTSKGAGRETSVQEDPGKAGERRADSIAVTDQKHQAHANGESRNSTESDGERRKDVPKETEGRGVNGNKVAVSQKEAEGSPKETENLRAEVEILKAEAENHRKEAQNLRKEAEEIQKEAEDHREEEQGPESAGRRRGDERKERGGDRMCGWCFKKQKERAPGAPKFKKCARCEGVFYCNAECQRLHWSEHKQACARTSS